MAFPTVAASGSGQEASLVTSHNVAVPAAPGVGNVLLVIIHTTGTSNTVTPPAGFVRVGIDDPWGLLSAQWQTTTGPWVFAKRSNGTETTPAVFTTGATARSTHVWMEISNVSDDTLWSGIRITSATGASTTPNPPVNSVPTTDIWNDSDVLYLAATSWTTTTSTFTSHPSTYTAVATEKVASQATGIAVARKNVAALSEDPGTFALSATSAWVALTIAIRNNDNRLPAPRATQLVEEVAYEAEPELRVTQVVEEVTYGAIPALNLTQLILEVAYIPGANNPDWYFRLIRREDDMTLILKQSTAAQTVVIGPFIDDTDFKTTEVALTIANTDIKISKNGAAAVNKTSGGATHIVNGEYAITLDATDTDTIGELRISVVVAGALPVVRTIQIVEEVVYDALYAVSAPGFLGTTTNTTITNIENILNDITGDTFNTTTMNLEEIYNIVNDSSTDITEIMGDTFNTAIHNLEEIYNSITNVDTLIQEFRGGTFNIDTDTLENIYNTLITIPASGDERTISRAGKDDITYTETITPP